MLNDNIFNIYYINILVNILFFENIILTLSIYKNNPPMAHKHKFILYFLQAQ